MKIVPEEKLNRMIALAHKYAERLPNADSIDAFNVILNALVENEKGNYDDTAPKGKRLVAFHCFVDAGLGEKETIEAAFTELWGRVKFDTPFDPSALRVVGKSKIRS